MKILIATTYMYNEKWQEFTKNKTGFGIMVKNIMEQLSQKEDVKVITHVLTNGREGKILPHSKKSVITKARFKDWASGIKGMFKYKQSLKGRVQYLYYGLNKGFVRNTIKSENPDIVHIHGINYATKTYIDICKELKQPYVVTLHGLIGIDSLVNANQWDRQLEKEFLIEANKKNIGVTVVSTGMKKRIEANYIKGKSDNIYPVLNGIDISHPAKINKREIITSLDHILEKIMKAKDNGKKICVCVGNITDNKNQMGVVKSFENVTVDSILVLLGRECDGGKVRKYVEDKKLNDRVILAGFCTEMNRIWEVADLNIFFSKNDGFGLSVVEGYVWGVPAIMYDDLDATDDVYLKCGMRKIHRIGAYEDGKEIEEALNTDWNKEEIAESTDKFSLDIMAHNYIEVLKKYC